MLRKAGKLTAILMAGLMTVSPLTEVAVFADELEIVTDETIPTEDVLTTDDPETGDTVEMEMTTEDGSVVTNSFEAEETADDELINSGSDDVVMPGVDEDADAVSGAGQDDLEADTAVLPTNGRVLRLASAGTGIKAGQHIYFGKKPNGFEYTDLEGKEFPYWRVLHPTRANDGNTPENGTTKHMFVMSEKLWGKDPYNSTNPGSIVFNKEKKSGQDKKNDWQKSDAQTDFCKELYKNGFSDAEKAAIKGFSKTDAKITDNTNEAKGITGGWDFCQLTVDDKVFFLSAKEVFDYVSDNEWPGEDKARQAGFWESPQGNWWLRSPSASNADNAGVIFGNGSVKTRSCSNINAARPAFNIDMSKILFTSASIDGKSSGKVGAGALDIVTEDDVPAWKLTVKDESREFKAERKDVGKKVKPGSNIKISYSGAKTGSNEYVSAVLCDSKANNVLYYGRLVKGKASGETDITIPSDLKDGTYILMVFSEQYNGDRYTDYASKMSDISIVVETPKSKLPQTITASNFTKKVGDAAFNIGAKTNGDGKLTYSSSDQKVAKVDASGKVTIVGPGKANITIKAGATEKYEPSQKIIEIVVKKDITKAKISGIKKWYYNGKVRRQDPVVKIGNKILERRKDYGIKYITKDRINAGKVKFQIIGKGDYSGTINKSYRIYPAKNTLSVSVKKVNVEASEIKSKNKKLKTKDVFKVKKAIGKVTYKKLSGKAKITVASNGKVTVKKGLEAGKYKVKVKVKAKGDKNHKSKSKTVTITIVVK